MKRAINVLKNWERDVMLAAKFGQTVVITEPTFDDLMDEAWDQFEDEEQMVEEEFCKNARDNFSRKNCRAKRRKQEFKHRAKKKENARYWRSGLRIADSGAVQNRVGSTWSLMPSDKLSKRELNKLIESQIEDEKFLNSQEEEYESWLDWQAQLDYEEWLEMKALDRHDDYDYDYDDYDCDYDYDDFQSESDITDIEVSLSAKYEEGYEKGYKAGQFFGYNEGYDAGYIAAMKELGRA